MADTLKIFFIVIDITLFIEDQDIINGIQHMQLYCQASELRFMANFGQNSKKRRMG